MMLDGYFGHVTSVPRGLPLLQRIAIELALDDGEFFHGDVDYKYGQLL